MTKLRLKSNEKYINNSNMRCIVLRKGQCKLCKSLLGEMHQIEIGSDIGAVRINKDMLREYDAVYQLVE